MGGQVYLRESRCFDWKVKNIFCVHSVETETFSFNGSSWKLLLLKLGSGEKEKIVIYLHKTDSEEALSKRIRSHAFIEGNKRMAHFPKWRNEWRSDVCIWWRYTTQLWEKEEILLADGVITFVFIFVVENAAEDEAQREAFKETLANVEMGIGLENFSPHLHHLLDMKASPDVMLKCGDYVIPAHKSTLCARSEVFLDLFRSDQTRSPCEILEISDMEPLILDQLVKYIYTGKVSDLSMDSAQQLYAAADKHAIESLKGLCGNFLMENLAEENACDVLAFAEAHSDTDIKDCALSFIIETELLRDDDHWLKFRQEHSELAADVLHMVYKATCLAK